VRAVRAGADEGRRGSPARSRLAGPGLRARSAPPRSALLVVLALLAPLVLAGTGGCERGAAPARGTEAAASTPAGAPAPPPARRAQAGPISVPVELGGERFHLELAADPRSRYRGLGGREHLPEGSGMLFAFPEAAPRAFVMRRCLIPLDVAFLDSEGRVVAVHRMQVEPPPRPGESPAAYEARLPRYPSRAPARFAVEVRGGRLAALGVAPGDRVAFDREAVLERTR